MDTAYGHPNRSGTPLDVLDISRRAHSASPEDRGNGEMAGKSMIYNGRQIIGGHCAQKIQDKGRKRVVLAQEFMKRSQV